MKRLQEKTVLINADGQGIGCTIAEAMILEGATLIMIITDVKLTLRE